jgi:hypothetical protein
MDKSCFYCLYRLWDNTSASPLSAPQPHDGNKEVPTHAPKDSVDSHSQDASSDIRRLEVVATDLDPEFDEKLKLNKFIMQKIERNLMYENGSLGYLPALVTKGKVSATTACFYSLLTVDAQTKYILCLISLTESSGFDLYVRLMNEPFFGESPRGLAHMSWWLTRYPHE